MSDPHRGSRPHALTGRVAIVTGGAQGLGRAVVERFLAENAKVGLIDVDAERGAATAAELGDDVLFAHADVGREDEVAAAVAATAKRFGGVDVLVNNAGVNAY